MFSCSVRMSNYSKFNWKTFLRDKEALCDCSFPTFWDLWRSSFRTGKFVVLWNERSEQTNKLQWLVEWKSHRRSLEGEWRESKRQRKENTCGKGERPRQTDEDGWRGRLAGRPPRSPVMDDGPVIPLITWQDTCKTLRKYFLSRFVGSAAKAPDVLLLYGREETLNPTLSSCRRWAVRTFLRNVQHVSRGTTSELNCAMISPLGWDTCREGGSFIVSKQHVCAIKETKQTELLGSIQRKQSNYEYSIRK